MADRASKKSGHALMRTSGELPRTTGMLWAAISTAMNLFTSEALIEQRYGEELACVEVVLPGDMAPEARACVLNLLTACVLYAIEAYLEVLPPAASAYLTSVLRRGRRKPSDPAPAAAAAAAADAAAAAAAGGGGDGGDDGDDDSMLDMEVEEGEEDEEGGGASAAASAAAGDGDGDGDGDADADDGSGPREAWSVRHMDEFTAAVQRALDVGGVYGAMFDAAAVAEAIAANGFKLPRVGVRDQRVTYWLMRVSHGVLTPPSDGVLAEDAKVPFVTQRVTDDGAFDVRFYVPRQHLLLRSMEPVFMVLKDAYNAIMGANGGKSERYKLNIGAQSVRGALKSLHAVMRTNSGEHYDVATVVRTVVCAGVSVCPGGPELFDECITTRGYSEDHVTEAHVFMTSGHTSWFPRWLPITMQTLIPSAHFLASVLEPFQVAMVDQAPAIMNDDIRIKDMFAAARRVDMNVLAAAVGEEHTATIVGLVRAHAGLGPDLPAPACLRVFTAGIVTRMASMVLQTPPEMHGDVMYRGAGGMDAILDAGFNAPVPIRQNARGLPWMCGPAVDPMLLVTGAYVAGAHIMGEFFNPTASETYVPCVFNTSSSSRELIIVAACGPPSSGKSITLRKIADDKHCTQVSIVAERSTQAAFVSGDSVPGSAVAYSELTDIKGTISGTDPDKSKESTRAGPLNKRQLTIHKVATAPHTIANTNSGREAEAFVVHSADRHADQENAMRERVIIVFTHCVGTAQVNYALLEEAVHTSPLDMSAAATCAGDDAGAGADAGAGDLDDAFCENLFGPAEPDDVGGAAHTFAELAYAHKDALVRTVTQVASMEYLLELLPATVRSEARLAAEKMEELIMQHTPDGLGQSRSARKRRFAVDFQTGAILRSLLSVAHAAYPGADMCTTATLVGMELAAMLRQERLRRAVRHALLRASQCAMPFVFGCRTTVTTITSRLVEAINTSPITAQSTAGAELLFSADGVSGTVRLVGDVPADAGAIVVRTKVTGDTVSYATTAASLTGLPQMVDKAAEYVSTLVLFGTGAQNAHEVTHNALAARADANEALLPTMAGIPLLASLSTTSAIVAACGNPGAGPDIAAAEATYQRVAVDPAADVYGLTSVLLGPELERVRVPEDEERFSGFSTLTMRNPLATAAVQGLPTSAPATDTEYIMSLTVARRSEYVRVLMTFARLLRAWTQHELHTIVSFAEALGCPERPGAGAGAGAAPGSASMGTPVSLFARTGLGDDEDDGRSAAATRASAIRAVELLKSVLFGTDGRRAVLLPIEAALGNISSNMDAELSALSWVHNQLLVNSERGIAYVCAAWTRELNNYVEALNTGLDTFEMARKINELDAVRGANLRSAASDNVASVSELVTRAREVGLGTARNVGSAPGDKDRERLSGSINVAHDPLGPTRAAHYIMDPACDLVVSMFWDTMLRGFMAAHVSSGSTAQCTTSPEFSDVPYVLGLALYGQDAARGRVVLSREETYRIVYGLAAHGIVAVGAERNVLVGARSAYGAVVAVVLGSRLVQRTTDEVGDIFARYVSMGRFFAYDTYNKTGSRICVDDPVHAGTAEGVGMYASDAGSYGMYVSPAFSAIMRAAGAFGRPNFTHHALVPTAQGGRFRSKKAVETALARARRGRGAGAGADTTAWGAGMYPAVRGFIVGLLPAAEHIRALGISRLLRAQRVEGAEPEPELRALLDRTALAELGRSVLTRTALYPTFRQGMEVRVVRQVARLSPPAYLTNLPHTYAGIVTVSTRPLVFSEAGYAFMPPPVPDGDGDDDGLLISMGDLEGYSEAPSAGGAGGAYDARSTAGSLFGDEDSDADDHSEAFSSPVRR